MASEEESLYQPKDAVGIAIESTLILGAAGLTVSAIQNTLTKQNVSGWGVFTRTGGTIAIFAVLGFGAGLAIVQGTFDYTGGKFSGYEKDPNVDEYERKEYLRKNRRRPIQETLEQLGEGRGIYGPGYRERRADRIKDSYGIDVPRS
ncbi:hypothetical protein P7C71_g1763, partial [Lecanoromycetidae sp. Uapishka_2]